MRMLQSLERIIQGKKVERVSLYTCRKKHDFSLDFFQTTLYSSDSFGGLAQLGERLHGMQEVSGSIPLTSTKI